METQSTADGQPPTETCHPQNETQEGFIHLRREVQFTSREGPIHFVCGVNYLPSSALDGPMLPELTVATVLCCMQSTSHAGSTTDLVMDIHV